MTMTRKAINELKQLRGATVKYFGKAVTLPNTVDDLEIDTINILEDMEEYELDWYDFRYYTEDEDGNEILDEEGNKIPIARYGRWNEMTGESEEVYAIEPEQIDQLRELIASTEKKANYDSSIFDIVNEQAAAFFQGQKSAEEVAKLIQSKANIFVNEQR